jgi:hypothetical protein
MLPLGLLTSNRILIRQVFELLEQSKGCDTLAGENEGREEFEEELANLVTGGGLQPTRSYVNHRLNVYYSALRAFELHCTFLVEVPHPVAT